MLKCVIFHYHGLDEDEQKLLDETAKELDASEELKWANEFIAEDYYNAFDRARDHLHEPMLGIDKEKRIKYLTQVWNANQAKGYISEMEAMAMLKLAKDWDIEKELVNAIKG